MNTIAINKVGFMNFMHKTNYCYTNNKKITDSKGYGLFKLIS